MSRVAMSVSDRVEGRVGRIVVEDVEAAERLDRSLDHAHDVRFVRNVDLEWHRCIEFAGNTFRLGSVEVGDNHQRAFARHQPRRRLTDPAPSTGDDRNLAVQSPHSPSMSAAVVRLPVLG